MRRVSSCHGFSLIELLVAMVITAGIGAAAFQLFRQNARVFHDQDLIMDAQQMARASVSEIVDEIRMAGQGVPVFSADLDGTPSDGSAVILAGSGRARINLRSSRSNIESVVTTAPTTLTRGQTATVTVADASVFSSALGATPTGKFVYIWGPISTGWGWCRASIAAISAKAKSIQLTPVELSLNASSIQFTGPATITLEEAVAIFRDSASQSLRRATATDLSNPTAPLWAPANEMAVNVTSFVISYYDRNGAPITADTLLNRSAIGRVDFEIGIEVESALSTGLKPAYKFSSSVVPRNLKIP
jgi:prepilin-type N-terminal cleavage/methylation domain-containing protein